MTWPSDRSRDGGIDEVPLGPGVAGRLFLCGKHAICGDPEAVLARVGATTVVCLNDLDELRDRFPEYEKWLATNAPARALHHPIHDFCAPPLAALTTLVDELHTRLLAGESLIVHCGGGIGRSGTIAVALLMRLGVPRSDALRTVRAHRPMAGPEVGEQADVLVEYERQLASADGF